MKSGSVFRDYIDRELETTQSISQEDRSKLATIAEAFLKNELSYHQAVSVFAECSISSSLINKLAHVKAVGEVPLPNPVEPPDKPPEMKPVSRKKAILWRQEEDYRLRVAVSKYGSRDWKMVSAFVGGGRTSSQCNQRWTRALNPAINHKPWTEAEDKKLLELAEKMGCCKWRIIADALDGRTDLQCRHRFLQLSKKSALQEAPKPPDVPAVLEIPYLLNRAVNVV